jgi:hypothetical protein
MKKIFFATLLLAAFSSVSFAQAFIASGNTHSALGDYRIELAKNTVTVNGEKLKAYIISYENSPLKVTVAIQNQNDCKRYFALGDKLSVMYVCNKDYFGVEIIDKSLKIEGFSTSTAALDKRNYFHQKVLAPGKRGEIESTQLIAVYFPMLVNTDNLAAM